MTEQIENRMTTEDYLRTYRSDMPVGELMTVGEVLALYEKIDYTTTLLEALNDHLRTIERQIVDMIKKLP